MFTTVRCWLSLWLALCLATIPLSTTVLPPVGVWINRWMNHLTQPLSLYLFGADTSKSFLSSDSAALYSASILFLILSGVFVIFLHRKFRTTFRKVELISYYALLYLIIFFLLRYGMDKLAGNQFYAPAANTLFTPLGQLSKDILFWSSMGTSRFYNLFMGTTEVLAALLLIFPRTRFLGSLMAFGICLHIFAVNVGFDITVKYLSGLLLLGSGTLLSYFPDRLSQLIQLPSRIYPALPQFQKTRRLHLLKWGMVAILVLECSPVLLLTQPADSGSSYTITGYTGTDPEWNLPSLKRLHFHPQGYLILETNSQHFQSFPITYSDAAIFVNGTKCHLKEDRIFWQAETGRVELYIQRINLRQLPALQDECHWTVESML